MDLARILPEIHRLGLQGNRCFWHIVDHLFLTCDIKAAKRLIPVKQNPQIFAVVKLESICREWHHLPHTTVVIHCFPPVSRMCVILCWSGCCNTHHTSYNCILLTVWWGWSNTVFYQTTATEKEKQKGGHSSACLHSCASLIWKWYFRQLDTLYGRFNVSVKGASCFYCRE